MATKQEKATNWSMIGSSVGFVAGLGYAFKNKKKFWGYVGYSLLGSLMFGTAAGVTGFVMSKDDAPKPVVK